MILTEIMGNTFKKIKKEKYDLNLKDVCIHWRKQ